MARSRQPQGYPTVFYDLIESVVERQEPFTLECATDKKAMLMRFQFYDFIKACRKSSNRRENAIGEMAYGLIFSIRGKTMTISIRDSADDAQDLQNALNSYTRGSSEVIGAKVDLQREEKHGHVAPLQSFPKEPVNLADDHEDMINQFMNKDKGK